MPKQPNFVLFITDQHRTDFLGCYGHPLLQTPNIDRMAAHGHAFDRFYVSSPVCMPNRASLMTGRMPSVHGVRANGIPLSTASVTFVDLLRDAGYATALIGKSHLQNFSGAGPLRKKPESPPGFLTPSDDNAQAVRQDLTTPVYQQESPEFWKAPTPKIDTPFYGFDHVELVTSHGDGVGGDYVQWLLERKPDAANLIGEENQLPHDFVCPQAVRTAVPEELYSTNYIAERARDYLEKHDDTDQPFFLMVSFPDPHHPFNPPGRYWDMYDPDDFPVPEAFSRNDWVPPPHVQAVIDERDNGQANLNGMNSIGVTAREAQEAQALTCGMITCVDDAVGGVMQMLDDMGLSDNTVTAFTADHGDHLGEHRLMLKGAEHYQSIIRVPFIWSDPALENSSARTPALASTKDIPATILERARLAPYIGLQGRSLLPVIEGGAEDIQDTVVIQYDHQKTNAGLGGPPRVHSLINGRWRLTVFRQNTWGELYDLENDPGEFANLWDDPDHAETKARLLELLLHEEIDTIDDVPFPTGRA